MKNKPVVVGIGVSAGGFEVLRFFFKNMPKSSIFTGIVDFVLSPDKKQ